MQPEKKQKRGSAGGRAAAAARRRQLAVVLDAFGTEPTCAWELSQRLGIPNLWVLARELERLGHLLDVGGRSFVRCTRWGRETGPEFSVIYGGRSSAPPAAVALACDHHHGAGA